MKYVVCNDSRVDSLVAIMLNRYVKEKRRSNRGYKNCRFSDDAQIDVSQSRFGIAWIHYSCVRAVSIFQDWSMLIRDAKRPTTITDNSSLHRALLFFSTNGALSRCRRTVLCVNEFHGSIQTCTWYNEFGDNTADNTRLRWWETIVTATVVVVHCWLTEKVMSQSSNSRNTKVKITLFWILIKILVINKQSNFLTKKFWPSWRQNDFWLKNFIEIKNQNKVISIFCWILRVR